MRGRIAVVIETLPSSLSSLVSSSITGVCFLCCCFRDLMVAILRDGYFSATTFSISTDH